MRQPIPNLADTSLTYMSILPTSSFVVIATLNYPPQELEAWMFHLKFANQVVNRIILSHIYRLETVCSVRIVERSWSYINIIDDYTNCTDLFHQGFVL